MAKLKKVEEVKEVVESLEEKVCTPECKRKVELQNRLKELTDLRTQLVENGIDSLGKLDVIASKVIQEIDSI